MRTLTRTLTRACLLSVLALAASCNEKLTEMLVVVSNAGLVIGDEIDAVDITLRDPTGVVGHQQRVPLCGTNSATSAQCLYFPFSVLLVPGDQRPGTPVEVQIDAIKGGQKVIANVAIFRFTKKKTLRLDVILYPDCIDNLSCAEQKKACVQNGQCADLTPTDSDPDNLPKQPDLLGVTIDQSIMPPDDLVGADLVGADFSVPPDQSVVLDMSGPLPDMTTLPDLVQLDFTGCEASCSGRQCGTDGCASKCGECTGFTYCLDSGFPSQSFCMTCGQSSQPCCPIGNPSGRCESGLECQTGICAPLQDMRPPIDMLACGQLGQVCCPGSLCFQGSCNGTFCVPDDMLGLSDMGITIGLDGGGFK